MSDEKLTKYNLIKITPFRALTFSICALALTKNISSNYFLRFCWKNGGKCESLKLTVDEETQELNQVEIKNQSKYGIINLVILKCEKNKVITEKHSFTDETQTNYEMKFIPTGIFNLFNSKITQFIFDGCKEMNELKGNEFNDGASLENVTVINTNLSIVSDKSFDHLGHVYTLNLSSNSLKVLSDGIFKSLKNVSYLNLSHNKLECLQENLFKFNLKLKHLYVENNRINYVGLLQFESIKIKTAYFEGNLCANQNYLDSQIKMAFVVFLSSNNCSNEKNCRNEILNDSDDLVLTSQNSLIVLVCVVIFLVIDVTLATVIITKRVRSIQMETDRSTDVSVYNGFHFYDTPKLIFSTQR